MAARKAWTPDEDQLLIRLYGSVPVEDIAARLGRSESSVMHHASHLGVHRRQPWTDEQERVLLRTYPLIGVACAPLCGHSPDASAEHARLCGCRRLPEHSPKPNAARRAALTEALRWCASFDIVGSDAACLCADACGCTPHMVMLVAARLRK